MTDFWISSLINVTLWFFLFENVKKTDAQIGHDRIVMICNDYRLNCRLFVLIDKVCSYSQENFEDKQSLLIRLSVHAGSCDKNVAIENLNSLEEECFDVNLLPLFLTNERAH